MSDRVLLCVALALNLLACMALELLGHHPSPGPCEVALVLAGGLAALAQRAPPDPPGPAPRG